MMDNALAKFLVIFVFCGSVLGIGFSQHHSATVSTGPEAGRAVYITEGCLNCHSQYSRAGTPDTELYGPPTPVASGSGDPVLIGNRRQGPDLANVGARRSREWNRAHLMAPSELSPGSRMPGYRHLFSAGVQSRGESLLDYLDSLVTDPVAWSRQTSDWRPAVDLEDGHADRGKDIYSRNCQQCHGDSGRGDGSVTGLLQSQPRDLVAGTFLYAPDAMEPGERSIRLAQILKYGVPGTAMPGHESLTDEEIVDLLAYLNALNAKPITE